MVEQVIGHSSVGRVALGDYAPRAPTDPVLVYLLLEFLQGVAWRFHLDQEVAGGDIEQGLLIAGRRLPHARPSGLSRSARACPESMLLLPGDLDRVAVVQAVAALDDE